MYFRKHFQCNYCRPCKFCWQKMRGELFNWPFMKKTDFRQKGASTKWNTNKTYLKQYKTRETFNFFQELLPAQILMISSVNMIKSPGNCRFGHIYQRNPQWKTVSFLKCFAQKSLTIFVKMAGDLFEKQFKKMKKF